jgi:hypothetical protein
MTLITEAQRAELLANGIAGRNAARAGLDFDPKPVVEFVHAPLVLPLAPQRNRSRLYPSRLWPLPVDIFLARYQPGAMSKRSI